MGADPGRGGEGREHVSDRIGGGEPLKVDERYTAALKKQRDQRDQRKQMTQRRRPILRLVWDREDAEIARVRLAEVAAHPEMLLRGAELAAKLDEWANETDQKDTSDEKSMGQAGSDTE